MTTAQLSMQIAHVWKTEAQNALHLINIYHSHAENHHENGALGKTQLYLELITNRVALIDNVVSSLSQRLQSIRDTEQLYDKGIAEDINEVNDIRGAAIALRLILRTVTDMSTNAHRRRVAVEMLLKQPDRATAWHKIDKGPLRHEDMPKTCDYCGHIAAHYRVNIDLNDERKSTTLKDVLCVDCHNEKWKDRPTQGRSELIPDDDLVVPKLTTTV